VRYILASWDCDGFECLQDITGLHPDSYEKTQIVDALKGNTPKANPLFHQLSAMTLRARFNSHRTYEIYIFTTDDSVEFKDVEDWMIADPQSLVDWIRVNHYSKIYSDYHRKHKQIV
jgi:hypothetical protein